MNKIFKPASILFYLFVLLVFFLVGVYYAGITGAAKGQGLAGGAIVLGYGVIFSVIAFIISLFVVYYTKPKIIVMINRILAVVLAIFIVLTTYRFMTREGKNTPIENHPKKPTAPAPDAMILKANSVSALRQPVEADRPMGLGFFKPNFYKNNVLYFYGNPNFEKPIDDHSPTDSIVFKHLENGGYEITYAPPWLVPDHLKLDYDILYFRIISIGRDFAEVIVNKTNQQIGYIDLNTGKAIYWPDFLLSINSVEFLEGKEQVIRYKPFHEAGEVNIAFQFMSPLLVRNNWMLVLLMDDNYKVQGKGWIQWKEDNKLLITYSLLS